ncbi:hypothetical protein L1049_018929 [Liquidambar formosana]|uniref:BURP domain-containing protein n=1 Tax=Liquidambar formosana TaxID=63359 RepID=A0AAP0RBN8_LIQFO
MLEILMRLKNVKNLDHHQSTLIENDYYLSIPPERSARVPKVCPPLHQLDLMEEWVVESGAPILDNEEVYSWDTKIVLAQHDFGFTFSTFRVGAVWEMSQNRVGPTRFLPLPFPLSELTRYGKWAKIVLGHHDLRKHPPPFLGLHLRSHLRCVYEGTQKMKLSFTKIPNGDNLLPLEVAESIPFSSNKLPEILSRFSINPKGAGARVMKEAIEVCEKPGNLGEDKYCATSLESLINFSVSQKGKKVQPLSTEVQTGTHDYKIGSGVAMVGSHTVACHQLSYPYAVFYCHATHSTRTYMATMGDADGVKSKAVAICHIDTSTWNPKNLAFQQLKVKPGTVSVCHFVPNGHIVWVSK